MADLKPCNRCTSGDVRWCAISHRPYCGECNHWGRVNYGADEYAIKAWNDDWEKHNTTAPVQADHCEDALNMVQAEQSLEVVAYRKPIHGGGYEYKSKYYAETTTFYQEAQALTDHAKATAALAQKDADIALLVAELCSAWVMCDQLRALLNEEAP